MKIIPTAGILIFENNKVLLVRHKDRASHRTSTYGLPAGKLSPNESEEQGAMRELTEETGLVSTAANLKELPTTYQATIEQKDSTRTFSFKVFLCEKYQGKLKESSKSAPEFIEINKLTNYNLLPNVREAIVEGLKQLTR